MNKTRIDWADYTINPVKGLCPMACSYCYARRMYKRYKWDETIRFEANPLYDIPIGAAVKPSRIFVGSTFELFGPWVQESWLKMIFEYVGYAKQHTFIFLTKRPENLHQWSPFPKNVWVGVSTNGNDCRSGLEDAFRGIQATVKFVSIEPLLDHIPMDFRWVDWVIVGAQTPSSKATQPRIEWIQDIVACADRDGAAVFLKENLVKALWTTTFGGSSLPAFATIPSDRFQLRQDYPRVSDLRDGV